MTVTSTITNTTANRIWFGMSTSTRSGGSSCSSSNNDTSPTRNLMRCRKNRDPMSYYEAMETLGEGSMGNVIRVRKKACAIGGSARKSFVQREIINYHHLDEEKEVSEETERKQNNCLALFRFLFTFFPEATNDKFIKVATLSNGSPNNITTNNDNNCFWRSKENVTCLGRRPKNKKMNSCDSSKITTITSSYDSKNDVSQQNDIDNDTDTDDDDDDEKFSSSSLSVQEHKELFNNELTTTLRITKDMTYALKSIHLERCKDPMFEKELKNEIDILCAIDHPNIVRPMETFDYQGRLYILLELCSGGDLFTRDPYDEMTAKKIIFSLFSAVSYLHSRGIIHRDLKYENIMFVNPTSDQVKLIDFGLSQKFAANEHLHDRVGTVYTMAPELIAGDYDAKADVWSLGVIAFMLFSSSMPFFGKNRPAVVTKIVKGNYRFSAKRWNHVSTESKRFTKSLLQMNVKKRPTAEYVLQNNTSYWSSSISQEQQEREGKGLGAKHPINCDNKSTSSSDSSTVTNTSSGDDKNYVIQDKGILSKPLSIIDNKMDLVQTAIRNFSKYSKLKKLGLMVIAYKSTSDEIGYLLQIFNDMDTDKNGEISLEEFKAALAKEYNYPEETICNIFRSIDVDGNGAISYSEFVAATLEAHGNINEQDIAEAFDRIDCDDTGYITVKNLQEFLGDHMPKEYLDDIINEVDVNDDHFISFEEFSALWSEDYDMLESIDDEVKCRRIIHNKNKAIKSECNIASSITDSELADMDDIVNKIDTEKGSFYYKKQKEFSIRAE